MVVCEPLRIARLAAFCTNCATRARGQQHHWLSPLICFSHGLSSFYLNCFSISTVTWLSLPHSLSWIIPIATQRAGGRRLLPHHQQVPGAGIEPVQGFLGPRAPGQGRVSGSGMRGPNRRGQNYWETKFAKFGPGGPKNDWFLGAFRALN